MSARIFVGNLNYQTTQSQVETLFSQVGEVVEVFQPTDRNTGRPRGFAFVEFSDDDAAAEAIEKFNDFELDGRKLRVTEAEERPRRSPPSFDFDDGFGAPRRNDRRGAGKPKGSRRNIRGRKRSL